MRMLAGCAVVAACGSSPPSVPSPSPSPLPAEVVEAIRRGAATLAMPDDGTEVALVGGPELPLVEAYVNGAGPYRLLVDLGSNVVLLRRDVVDAAGARVLYDRPTSDIVRLRELRVGAAVWNDVTAGAYDDLDVDGVIGFNLVSDVTCRFDVPAQRFSLSRAALPPPDGATVLPLVLRGRMPYVRADLGGQEVHLNLDTGAVDHLFMPSAWLDRFALAAGPVQGRMTYNEQSGPTRVQLARLAEPLRLGRWTTPTPLVAFNPAIEDAFLGIGFFADARVTVDGRNLRVAIERATPHSEWPIPDFVTHGVGITQRDGTWLVRDIIPATPAAGANVRIGDQLLAIDGASTATLTWQRWRALSRKTAPLVLELRRGGATHAVDLPAVVLP